MSDKASEALFAPAFDGYGDAVAASFAKQGFLVGIGTRLEQVSPGRVVFVLPFSVAVTQQHGYFHGGAIGAIGDSAGGYAALSLMPEGSEVVSVEYKINFIRPAVGEFLRASGQVLRAGRSLTVARVDICAVGADGAEKDVAFMQGTFLRIAG